MLQSVGIHSSSLCPHFLLLSKNNTSRLSYQFFSFSMYELYFNAIYQKNERSSQTTSVTQCLAKTYMYIIQCSKGHHYLRFKFNVGLQPRYIDLFLFYHDFISRIYRLSRISHLPSISYLAFTTHICKYIYIYMISQLPSISYLAFTVPLVSRFYRSSLPIKSLYLDTSCDLNHFGLQSITIHYTKFWYQHVRVLPFSFNEFPSYRYVSLQYVKCALIYIVDYLKLNILYTCMNCYKHVGSMFC